jgi:hypothetical protein
MEYLHSDFFKKTSFYFCEIKVSKKTEKSIKLFKILKRFTGLVRFWFYKSEIKKTEPNPDQKKPEKNQVQPKKQGQTGFCHKKRIETG